MAKLKIEDLELFTNKVTPKHKEKLLTRAAVKDQFLYEALHDVLEAGFKQLAKEKGHPLDSPLTVGKS